ncbi:membrane protein YdbS with pleckstrin-like domain [Microbacterium resistens]|uniref:Membrane protein YdbS with pleckstrin-like domain n=1 Tax=Microbacterium resistens TaxID=156977 RepID=A0ABU1S9K7_9MICO|nr:PH domain-containing protein [Microbacterium resistens]MDR6866294.1 membrane protein YdbS with pleckstrin-like domain [Microbacterium resistens]
MTQPVGLGGRPMMPPPGAPPAEERLIARFHGSARHLFWSALVLIAVAGATAYFFGNLPAPFADWMLLAAAGALIILVVIVPFAVWLSRSYVVTTRRVIVKHGVGTRNRREMSHARGYTIAVRRGLLQRMSGAGTVVLTNGVDAPLRLAGVPYAALLHETLADQVEVGQILAHRDAQSSSTAEL